MDSRIQSLRKRVLGGDQTAAGRLAREKERMGKRFISLNPCISLRFDLHRCGNIGHVFIQMDATNIDGGRQPYITTIYEGRQYRPMTLWHNNAAFWDYLSPLSERNKGNPIGVPNRDNS